MSTAVFSMSQAGYFHFPSFSQFKLFLKLSAEYFEWWLVAILLSGFFLLSWHEQYMSKIIVESPQKNDFFFVDYFAIDRTSNTKFRYVPMKVIQVKEDSLVFKVGSVGHSTKASIDQHLGLDKAMLVENFYREESLELSYGEISELFQTGDLYSAARPRNIFINGWIVIGLNEL